MMNYINFFKKGGKKPKIHIKESQRGSFTRYCNGKVTEECIRRGKNSPDPKIRRKATFAANARTWKHQTGGELIRDNKNKKSLYSRAMVGDLEEVTVKPNSNIYLPEGKFTYSVETTTPIISSETTTDPYDLSGYIFPEVKEAIQQDSKAITFKDRNEFIASLSSAYKSAGFNDDLVKLLVAQDALESGWGRSIVGDYNYGNIKKGSSWKGKTKRAYDKREGSNDEYRSYNNFYEYVADKVALLTRTYGITRDDTVESAIAKLNGNNPGKWKYATGKEYAQSLLRTYQSLA